VVELLGYFDGDERLGITAVPGVGQRVEPWILGSSLFGAQLAAMLGMPYAFASHFAPDALLQALDVYRRHFKPSAYRSAPYCAAAMNVFAAERGEEAELLATSQMQAFVALRTGTPGKLPPPVEGYRDSLPPNARVMLDHVLQYSAVGTGATCAAGIRAFAAQTGVDEVIVCGSFHDHAARKTSLALTMAAMVGGDD
jgi:luciferase family oxidoreductase group 1